MEIKLPTYDDADRYTDYDSAFILQCIHEYSIRDIPVTYEDVKRLHCKLKYNKFIYAADCGQLFTHVWPKIEVCLDKTSAIRHSKNMSGHSCAEYIYVIYSLREDVWNSIHNVIYNKLTKDSLHLFLFTDDTNIINNVFDIYTFLFVIDWGLYTQISRMYKDLAVFNPVDYDIDTFALYVHKHFSNNKEHSTSRIEETIQFVYKYRIYILSNIQET